MKKVLIFAVASTVLLCLPSAPRAEMRERSMEVGAYLTGADFDNESNVDNEVGLGGRFAIVFVPHHELEFSLDFIRTQPDYPSYLNVDLSTFKMGYVFNIIPNAAVSPFLMAGAGFQNLQVSEDDYYGSYVLTDETNPLAYAGAGVRFFLGPVLNIRVEGQVVAVYPDGDSVDQLTDHVFNLGVGWVFGGH